MKILVYGAGAVGGYLGGHLANAGHAVTLVVRQPVADAIAENGLSIQEDEDLIQTQPTATTSLRQALLDESAYDLILATMKAYDAEDALNQLVAFCPSPPPIITMQNGIGIEESFAREFGPQRVIAGSLTTPLSLETNSSIVVEHSGRGLVLAPVARKQSVKRWAGIFNEAGIQTTTEKSFESLKWSKALVNMIGNASSAILNRHPKVVYEYGPTFKLEMRMLKETLAVMRKKKIKPVDLPGVTTGRLVFAVRRMP